MSKELAKKAGRPSAFQEKFIEEGRRLMRLGLSQKKMAYFWAVSEDSLTRWKEEYPEFADALKKGEADRDIELLDAMRDLAMRKKSPAMLIFLAKNWLGMRDVVDQQLSAEKPLRIEIVPASNGDQKK